MISTPATLDKYDLPELPRGKVNDRPLTINGQTFPTRSLRFVKFAGSLRAGLYRGSFLFQQHDGSAAEAADLNQLLKDPDGV